MAADTEQNKKELVQITLTIRKKSLDMFDKFIASQHPRIRNRSQFFELAGYEYKRQNE